jgi:hypothetical protein
MSTASENAELLPRTERLRRAALLVGVAGLIACGVCYALSPPMFFRVYLTGYIYCLGFPLGSMAIALIYRLTGGGWGRMIVRPLEAAIRTLPLAALLFVPIVLGLNFGGLYLWSNSAMMNADPALAHKASYLNVQAFEIRAAVYFVVWLVLGKLLSGWSRQVAEGRAPERLLTLFAGPGLIVWALTNTFAAIDWQMSLEPHWYSTIFPVVYAMGQILAAFALAALMLTSLAPLPVLEKPQGRSVLQDLGSLQLAFVMLWAYVAFSQFLLIWSGNLPEEIAYYTPRLTGGWQIVAGLMTFLQFALPFVLLLSRSIKRSPWALGRLCLFLVAMHLVEVVWQILPTQPPGTVWDHALELVAVLPAVAGIGGLMLAVGLGQVHNLPAPPWETRSIVEGHGHG